MPDSNGFMILPGSGGDRIVYKDGIIVATFHGVKAGSDEPEKFAKLFLIGLKLSEYDYASEIAVLLAQCKSSLEYVNDSHPYQDGWGVRADLATRIQNILAKLPKE